MDYVFTGKSFKQLQKLPKSVQKRIIAKLDFYSSHPNPIRFADHLTKFDLGTYRYRVGDYRIVFDIDAENLLILLIDHRKNIYR